MFSVYLSIFISFALCYVSLPVMILIAQEKKLFDQPNSRKLHVAPTSNLGGIAIFIGLIVSLLYCLPLATVPQFQYFLLAVLIIFFLGVKDDILVLAPTKKLLGQFLAAVCIVVKGELVITNFHGFAGIGVVHPALAIVFTLLFIIVTTNAFNLIDGIDGLASILGLIASVAFGYHFVINGDIAYGIFSFSLAGSLLAFLSFNLSPARIFMGDTGSLLLGLITSILVIHYLEGTPAGPRLLSPGLPAVAFSVIMIPLLDLLRVFSVRIWNKRSPFSADKNHIHHLLVAAGLSHNRITCILLASSLSFIAFAYYFSHYGVTTIVAVLMGFYFLSVWGLKLRLSAIKNTISIAKHEQPAPRFKAFFRASVPSGELVNDN